MNAPALDDEVLLVGTGGKVHRPAEDGDGPACHIPQREREYRPKTWRSVEPIYRDRLCSASQCFGEG